MSNTKLLLAVVAAAVLGAASGFGGYYFYERAQENAELSRRPDFTLPDLQDQPQNVAQWDGKVLVLNFWATWCPPCVREVPILVEMQRELGSQGLQIVGIAVDRREDVETFAKQMSINYPLLYGVQTAMEVSQLYGDDAGTLPYTVVVDRDGTIQQVFRKELDRASLEQAIRPLLQN